jgi:hypothetical protein
MLCVCLCLCVRLHLCVCLCVSLSLCVCVPEQFDELHAYSAFTSSFIMGLFLSNMNILAPKIRRPSDGPKRQNGDFLETTKKDFH